MRSPDTVSGSLERFKAFVICQGMVMVVWQGIDGSFAKKTEICPDVTPNRASGERRLRITSRDPSYLVLLQFLPQSR